MNNTNKLLGAGLIIALVVIGYQFGVNSGTVPIIDDTNDTVEKVIEDDTKKVNNLPVSPITSDEQKDKTEEPAEKPNEKPAEEDEILCTAVYIPVCGFVRGQKTDFGNECEAGKAGASNISDGVCEEPEPPAEDVQCPANYNPVCGNVGIQKKTFVNQCEAQKANASNISDGKCTEPGLQITP